VQKFVAASQKSTCPVVTGVAPYATEAVNVTTVPDETDVAAEPPAVTDREVDVAVCPKTAGACRAPSAIKNPTRARAAKLSLTQVFGRTMEEGIKPLLGQEGRYFMGSYLENALLP
jgi:hypothetical protein